MADPAEGSPEVKEPTAEATAPDAAPASAALAQVDEDTLNAWHQDQSSKCLGSFFAHVAYEQPAS